jgi:beta-lactam-binding protein with PASTA domain
VEVRPGPLIGLPVTMAVHRLHQQGLSVHIVWRRSSGQPAGTVLSVQPAGQRPVGSLVTLTVARTARHGQRGDGDQQGDGSQQGGGDRQGGASHGKAQGHHKQDPAGGSTVD